MKKIFTKNNCANEIQVRSKRNNRGSFGLTYLPKSSTIMSTLGTSSYNITEKFRRFDWFIASQFPRNSGITAKIDGITRLPCYTTAAVTAKAVIYKLLSFNCFMFALNGLYWFHKKLSIISSIDVKRLLRT